MVETHQQTSKKRKLNYLAAISFTLLILIIGITIGWVYSNSIINKFQNEQEKLNLLINGIDVTNQLYESNECNTSLNDIFSLKNNVGKEVSDLEERLGKQDKYVLLKKELYQLVEIKTFLLTQKLKSNCNYTYDTILFFYSNSDKDRLSMGRSEDQGYILDNLYSRNKEKIFIFSFDINNENPALIALKKNYNITQSPSLVINGITYPEFKPLIAIESLI